jgi:hypothetical protein
VTARFPAFFEEHAYLPKGICDPLQRTEWELAHPDRATEANRVPSSGLTAGDGLEYEEYVDGVVDAAPPIETEGDEAKAYDTDRLLTLADLGIETWDIQEDQRLHGRPLADVMAAYRPWHFHGAGWGIDFYGRAINEFIVGMHTAVNRRGKYKSLDVVAHHVRFAVLQHELFHMRSEIAATQLEVLVGVHGES